MAWPTKKLLLKHAAALRASKRAYDKGGQSAVHDYANKRLWPPGFWHRCEACESLEPVALTMDKKWICMTCWSAVSKEIK